MVTPSLNPSASMLRISDTIKLILNQNPYLQFGFNNNLFNLTQLAKFIKPLVEAKAKKTATASALLMNLSRIHRQQCRKIPPIENFYIDNITVHGNLCTRTYYKNEQIHLQIQKLYNQIQHNKGYITLAEGVSEITVITHQDYLQELDQMIKETPKSDFRDLSAVIVKFHPKFIDRPGMLFFLMQQITMQSINVIEISSTYTELIFYIQSRDTKLAFETIEHCFG
jgi:aspartokinase